MWGDGRFLVDCGERLQLVVNTNIIVTIMKFFLTIIIFLLSHVRSFGQTEKEYKYTYDIYLNFPIKKFCDSSNKKNDSSKITYAFHQFIRRFQISSKRKLVDAEIEVIKKCIKTNPGNPGSCSKKDEYDVEGIL